MFRRNALFCVVAASSFFTACGPNNTSPNIINANNTNNTTQNNSNNSNNNNNSNNTSNSNNTNNMTIDPNNETIGCEMLEIETFEDESFEIEREFNASASVDILSCRSDVGELATSGSYVIRLLYSQDTTLDIDVAAISSGDGIPPRPGAELRRASCADGAPVFCDTTSSYSAMVEANTPYFLFLNGLLSSGGVSLAVDADGAVCTPDEQTCNAGMVSTCNGDGSAVNESMCAQDCAGDACAGDLCDTPFVVSPTPNGDPVVLSGARDAITPTWDAMQGAGCDPLEEGLNFDTPWPEVFVRVENVAAGQRVIFDAEEGPGEAQFYVLESCAATTCVDAFAYDENLRNRGTVTAQTAGDVLVAVEFPIESQTFNVAVSIQE